MKIAVIGTGYVGLVSGTCLAEMGNDVVCVDNDQTKLEKLKNAEVTIYEPGLEVLFRRNISDRRLLFTDDPQRAVLHAEIIFLCLPTPQDEDGSADLTHVLDIAGTIADILKDNPDHEFKIIVNKSTVPVGSALKVKELVGQHGATRFAVVSNPEFLKEGYAVEDFMKPNRTVIGSDNPQALEKMRLLYKPFVRQGNPIIEMDTASAEVTKYAANAYLATRITFMNELANFCGPAGANIDLIRRGMGTDERIGKRFLFAGIGYGGSCFPKDVNALMKTAQDHGADLTILGAVDQANQRQKRILANTVIAHFNGDLVGKHFAVWGLAFKPNTDDMREAPSITIIDMLLGSGASVSAYDPAAMESARKHHFLDRIAYATSDYAALENADALLILTEWNEFRNPDFAAMKTKMKTPLIFDGRNIYDPREITERGFTYFSIGRQTVSDKGPSSSTQIER